MIKKLVNGNYVLLLLMVLQLILALVTMHDVATAQGVGLYCAMQSGSTERLPYDILVDVCGMVTLIILLICPSILLKHGNKEAIFRLMCGYFAFMPSTSMAKLIHLFDGHNLFVVEFDFENSMILLSNFPRVVIPAMAILYFLYVKGGFKARKWHKILFIAVIALGMGMLFLPELSEVILHCIFYLLLVIAFDWWESLYLNEKLYEKIIIWCMFGLLYGRGCLRMLQLLARYHI